MTRERQMAISIIDIFECFLADRGIEIPNSERDDYDEETSIIFGSDYYELEDAITQYLEDK